MRNKQIVALLMKLLGKEDSSEGSGNKDDKMYDDVAELLTLVLGQQADPSTQANVNSSNSDVIKLAGLLSTLMANKETPETQVEKAYGDGFYKDGAFDLSKITDEGLKAALTDYIGKQAAKDNQRLIDDAFAEELKNRTLSIDKELFTKLVDTSKVEVKDGKVTGMKEAFDALNDKGVYKGKASSPVTQGFNPVQNKEVNPITTANSLFAAAEAEAELNGK